MFTRSRMIAAIAVLGCGITIASAQDLGFSTSSGQTITLSGMRGNAVVLLFSGIQDPQRREELKALEALAERYQGKEVKFCWVSVNTPAEASNEQLKTFAASAPSVSVLRDVNQAAFKRFSGKQAQLPTIVVLDRQGAAVGQPRGGFNPNSDFINDLASILDRQLQR